MAYDFRKTPNFEYFLKESAWLFSKNIGYFTTALQKYPNEALHSEPDAEFDSYLYSPPPNVPSLVTTGSSAVNVTTTPQNASNNANTTNTNNTSSSITENTSESPQNNHANNNANNNGSPAHDSSNTSTMLTACIIKGLINFLSQETSQPLWNYEDITAKGKLDSKIFRIAIE